MERPSFARNESMSKRFSVRLPIWLSYLYIGKSLQILVYSIGYTWTTKYIQTQPACWSCSFYSKLIFTVWSYIYINTGTNYTETVTDVGKEAGTFINFISLGKPSETDSITFKISSKTPRGNKDSTKRHHHRHHKRQAGEQQFPKQVVTG